MEDALDQREFIIYFQPKVELKENIVIGAEALIRWKDPRRGLISPGEFIPLFERNGFITKLDRYVIRAGVHSPAPLAGRRISAHATVGESLPAQCGKPRLPGRLYPYPGPLPDT